MIEIATARATGASHRRANIPCQDSAAYDLTDRAAAISIADGLGSCELSHEGSQVAAQTAVRTAVQLANSPDVDAVDCWRQAVDAAREAVLDRAFAIAATPMSLATTLSLVVITQRRVVVGGIGDGIHVLRDQRGGLSLLGMGPPSDIANHTHTLLDPSYRERSFLDERERSHVDGVVLSSDGMDRLLTRGPIDDPFPFPGFVHGLLDAGRTAGWQPQDYEQLAVSLTESGHTDDDVGFAVARLTSPEPGFTTNMLSGRQLQVSRRLEAPRSDGWAIAGAPGLVLLPLERPIDIALAIELVLTRPPSGEQPSPSPPLAWPLDIAVDFRGAAYAILIRPAIGIGLDEVRISSPAQARTLADGAETAVSILHSLGYFNGNLQDSNFLVGARGEVQLADIRTAVTNRARPGWHELRDRRFLRKLHTSLLERVETDTRKSVENLV